MTSSRRKDHFILVVDDGADNRISMMLRRFSYRSHTATARKALAIVKSILPTLIIIAPAHSSERGLELLRQFKQGVTTSHIPLIGITRGDRNVKDACIESGAIACVHEPIDVEALYRTVQAAIEKNPRAHIRVRAVLPVKVHSRRYASLYGAYALALSSGGMFLRTMNPVSVNSRISLEFDLHGRSIAAETVVIYNCQARGGPCEESGIGLRFIDMSSRDRNIIRQFIHDEVMKDITSRPQ